MVSRNNMYGIPRAAVWQRFSLYLDGEPEGLIVVVSEASLDDASRAALQKSFAALGYGHSACTFLSLIAREDEDAVAKREDDHFVPSKRPLEKIEDITLFEAIEGLDPRILVATDADAAQACAKAYHHPFPLNESRRFFGRDARAFFSFTDLLADPEKKRSAWGQLRSLPPAPKKH